MTPEHILAWFQLAAMAVTGLTMVYKFGQLANELRMTVSSHHKRIKKLEKKERARERREKMT